MRVGRCCLERRPTLSPNIGRQGLEAALAGRDGTPVDLFDTRTDMARGIRVVTVRGEVDLATGPMLADALANGGTPLLVDLSAVEFMNSAGLATLLTARAVDGHAPRLPIACTPGGAVARLLTLTGLDTHFVSFASAEEALDSLAPAS